jgi:hypothetical protein
VTTLSDISHWWGGDLQTTNSGDLLTVSGTVRGEQRVVRRLMTNPATDTLPPDDIFDPTYGGGLPRAIGKRLDAPKLQAQCVAQMLLEDVVAKTPTPVVTLTQIDFTSIQVQLNYNDQPTNTPVVLSFTVSP